MDTGTQVFFYEQEFYVLSNFSAFSIFWEGMRYQTVEHAYQAEKFPHFSWVRTVITSATSAHDAFQMAQKNKDKRRPDWDEVKLRIMKRLLWTKVTQHDYVARKLLETGERELIENSWRDDFWGWGPNRDGKNWLGQLWMQVRDELRRNNVR